MMSKSMIFTYMYKIKNSLADIMHKKKQKKRFK